MSGPSPPPRQNEGAFYSRFGIRREDDAASLMRWHEWQGRWAHQLGIKQPPVVFRDPTFTWGDEQT